MLASLFRRWKPGPRLGHLTFTVYTRSQCGCCHKALDLLKSYQRRHGFAIEEVDVDSDPALVEAHGLSVPVVAVAGKIRFKGQINTVLLERLLAAEAASRVGNGQTSCGDGSAARHRH